MRKFHKTHVWLVVTVFVPSGFSGLMVLGVCCDILCPFQSLCHGLSSGVNHNATTRMETSPISVTCRQPDLSVQYHPWSKVDIRGSNLALFKRFGPKDGATWELHPGFGEYWFIPPLLVVAYPPPTSFIGSIFSGLSGVSLAWVQCG